MAIKTFTASLNGGDAVTANNDLIYKIYGNADGYTTAIATTGSHTTDADVTVTGDVVVIQNVDVGVETKFKISSVDEAANESILSNEYTGLTILFSDDFTGAVIDTGKWTKVESNVNRMEYTQNDELICTAKGVGTQATIENYLVAAAQDLGSLTVVAFDVLKGVENSNLWAIGLNEKIIPDLEGYIAIRKSNTDNNIWATVRAGTTTIINNEITLDIETTSIPFKIVIDADVKFYYWNGSAWVQIGVTTVAHGYSGNWYPFISMQDSTAATNFLNVDNFVVTDVDFSTLRP